ncbi:glycosyltransferase [Campylobacter coli]|uniref:glycosyltransferase n=1 Tax=Campylobacter coli TaxID=195 RepID=UPI0009A66056|nr:glycosyltransferase [Campylobacter coli]
MVSIIVPIYNVEKYLRQCLDSIITQTLKDIEIILVNDGSTDNCGVICDEYALKDKRIQVIHKTNAGLGAAYNTGLEMASGEYIGFVESDDWIEPNMYEELYTKAKETDVDVCISGFFWHKNNKDTKEETLLKVLNMEGNFNIQNYPQLIISHSSIWCKLYNHKFIKYNQIQFIDSSSNNGYYCDIPFWTKICCLAQNITKLDSCFYHYRIDNPNASSIDTRSDRKLLQIIPSLTNMLNIAKQYGKYNYLKEELVYNITLTAFRYFSNIQKSDKNEFFNQFRNLVLNLEITSDFKFQYFKISDYKNILRKQFLFAVLDNDYNLALEIAKALKINAKQRVQSHLSYRYGKIILDNYKSSFNFFKIPFLMIKEYLNFRKNPKINLPLEKYADYREALKIQSYFSYKMGNLIVQSKTPIAFIMLPFKIKQLHKQYKKSNMEKQIILKLNNIEKMLYETRSDLLASVIHPSIFSTYKNLHADQEIVIIGNGPSAKDYIPIKNAIHIGTNRAYYIDNIKLDYLFCQHAIYPEGDHELENYAKKNPNIKCFLGILPVTFHNNTTHYRHPPRMYYGYKNIFPYIIRKHGNLWAHDLSYEPMADFESVIFAALQFACFTNPLKIYLVGCDCSNGHFYDSDFYADFSLNSQIKTWTNIKKVLDRFYPNIEIISVNPVGLKGVFKDIYN